MLKCDGLWGFLHALIRVMTLCLIGPILQRFPGSPHLPLSHFSELAASCFCSLFYSSAALRTLALRAEEAGMHPCQWSSLVDLWLVVFGRCGEQSSHASSLHSQQNNECWQRTLSSVRKMMFSEHSYRCSLHRSEQVEFDAWRLHPNRL